jgi:two-component system OmpR family response regulator
MPHVLVVEDDGEIAAMVSSFLAAHGFQTAVVADGRQMDEALGRLPVDLVILDVMLPGESGLDLCRRLRVSTDLPVIMLTALGGDTDRIIGLELGADDYLPKPFNPHELLARVRAVLRRCGGPAADRKATVLGFNGWRLDLGLRELHAPDGARIQLTSLEFDLLAVFCQYPKQVLTRDQLQDLTGARSTLGRGIDIQVSRLRKKIEPNPHSPGLIRTVRSGGYVFSAAVTALRREPMPHRLPVS